MNRNTKKHLTDRTRRSFQLLPLILPAALFVFVFSYLPMGGAIIAFKDYNVRDGIFKSPWVGFGNFEFFFKSSDAWVILRNTLGLNILFIFTGIVVAVTLALVLYEIKSRVAIKIYQTSLILPHFLSWIIVAYIVYALLNPRIGILNNILVNINPAFENYNWYAKPNAWPGILLVAKIWKHMGMDLIVYYAGLMGINHEYFEAAELDGANKFQRIWHISIPSIKSLIIMMTILALGGIFRAEFGLFYSVPMNSGLLYETTDVIDTYIFRALKDLGDVGMSSAVGLFQSVVGLITVVTANKIVSKIDSDSALF